MKKYTHSILLFSLLFLVNCNSNSSDKRNNEANTLESFEIENTKKRIEILSQQTKMYSEILDTEFSLFNVNGFGNKVTFIPAASYWHYKIALKVEKNELEKWLIGMYNAENKNAQDSVWVNSILDNLDTTRKQNWIENMEKSNPKRFVMSSTNGRSKVIIVYQNDNSNEAIVFQRVIQN